MMQQAVGERKVMGSVASKRGVWLWLALGALACSSDHTALEGTGGGGSSATDRGGSGSGDAGPIDGLPPALDIDAPAEPVLAAAECPSNQFEHGICQPLPPVGPALGECPFSSLDGVCTPAPPALGNWTCPLAWDQVAPLPDPAAADLQLVGLERSTFCVPPGAGPCPVGTEPCAGELEGCATAATWPADASLRAAAPGFDGAILYVDVLAAAPGSGTREDPYPTLQAALGAAVNGSIIALGLGDHDAAPLELTARIALVGSCTNGSRLVAATSGAEALLEVSAAGARLADLALTGPRPALLVSAPGSASLERVRVDGGAGTALGAAGDGAALALRDVFVADTALDALDEGGIGVLIEGGASATLERVVLRDNGRQGLSVTGPGSSAVATDLAVLGTSSFEVVEDQVFGIGVTSGASLRLSRASLIENRNAALNVEGDGTFIEISDALIAGTFALDNFAGFGAFGGAGAAFDGARLLFFENQYGAGFGPDASLTLSDVNVYFTPPLSQGQFGLLVLDSLGVLERLRLVRNAATSFMVSGSELDVTDLALNGTEAVDGESALGFGLRVLEGVQMNLERASFSDNQGYAIEVAGGGSELFLSDLRVAGGTEVDDPFLSGGLSFHDSSGDASETRLTLARASFRGNPGSAISASGPSSRLGLEDVVLEGTRALAEEARGALFASDGVQVTAERLAVRDAVDGGINVFDAATRLVAADLVISDTHPFEVDADTGEGLSIFEATASVDRAAFVGNRGAGVWAAENADVVLRDVAIEGTLPAPESDGSAAGLSVFNASRMTGARVRSRANHGHGMVALLTPFISFTDFSSQDNAPGPDLHDGRGLTMAFSQVSLERAAFLRNRDNAVVLVGQECRTPETCYPPSQLQLRHAQIADTTRAACAASSCNDQPGGGGIVLIRNSALNLEDFDIRGSEVAGLQVIGQSLISARRGLITGNQIGINAQEVTLEDADFEAVRVNGNEVDRDTRELPVPEPSRLVDQLTEQLGLEP